MHPPATGESRTAHVKLPFERRDALVAHRGIRIEVADCGPGITDVDRALEDGYSTAGRLGLGLPGVRRLMDDIEIDSLPGRGTVVCVTKWMR